MVPERIILEHQLEYFELLKKYSRLLSNFEGDFVPENLSKFIGSGLSKSQLVIQQKGMYASVAAERVLQMHEEFHQFWKRNWDSQRRAIRQLKGRIIIIDEVLVEMPAAISKYGLFFEHIAFPDYLITLFDTNAINFSSTFQRFLPVLLNRIFLLLCNEMFFCPEVGNPIAIIAIGASHTMKDVYWARAKRSFDLAMKLMSELSDNTISEDDIRDPKVLARIPLDAFTRNPNLRDVISFTGSGLSSSEAVRAFVHSMHGMSGGDPTIFKISDVTGLHISLGGRLLTLMDLGGDGVVYAQDVAVHRNKWELYSWLMGNESRNTGALIGTTSSDQEIFHFAVESEHLSWLSTVPPDRILEIRKNHTIQAIREDFHTARCNIRSVPGCDVKEAVEKAGEFFSLQLHEHSKILDKLRRKKPWKLAASISGFGASTTVTVAATIWPPLVIPGAIASLFAGKSLLDVIKTRKQENEKLLMEETRPLGMMLQLHESIKS